MLFIFSLEFFGYFNIVRCFVKSCIKCIFKCKNQKKMQLPQELYSKCLFKFNLNGIAEIFLNIFTFTYFYIHLYRTLYEYLVLFLFKSLLFYIIHSYLSFKLKTYFYRFSSIFENLNLNNSYT